MLHSTLPYLDAAIPEIFLAVMTLILLMTGVFRKGDNLRFITIFAVITLTVTTLMVMNMQQISHDVTFNGLFIMDHFAAFTKLLVLIGAGLSLILSVSYLEQEGAARFEFPVLILFSTLGMMFMISANSLMSLYMGLEMQSLPLYVLATFKRNNLRASEAGLKYFVLGALSSGLLLYGISLIYGYTGTMGFEEIGQALPAQLPIGLIVGLVFLLAGMAFKISAVPFHMWTPDVYEGAPTPVTALLAIVPKVAALALLVRLLSGPFSEMQAQWQQIIIVLSVASMIVGAFGALGQTNIKRLLGYSTIGHMGYALVALVAGSREGVQALLVYLLIYMIMSAGVFAIVLSMRRAGRAVEEIADLSGLSRTQPFVALALGILMFSMAGIPPLAGFFGKLFVFKVAIEGGFIALAIFGVVTSVVAAFYYLRVIRVMYFDPPAEKFDTPQVAELQTVTALSIAFIVLFILFPDVILKTTYAATQALGSL